MIFPSIAREFDQINYILQKSENVQVYLIETMTYKSLTYKETILEPDVSVTVTWPNESFILILASDDGEKADFSISYQFNDRDPLKVIEEMTPEERALYYETSAIVDKESVKDTSTFWLFIAGGIVGVILIGILVYFLIRLKKKNDLIVAKVEKLTESQIMMNEKDPSKGKKNDDFYKSQVEAFQKQ